jgi:uncharacterized protein YueI
MSTAVLEQFIKKYQTAKAYNSKEIRLTLLEAEELNLAIALVLAQQNSLNSKIIKLQEQLLADKNEIQMSGGSFT